MISPQIEQTYQDVRPRSCSGSLRRPWVAGSARAKSPPTVSAKAARANFDVNHLLGLRELETDLTVAYARVSSPDQTDDLKRQAENLERYCARKGWRQELIQDLGSGMNYRKKA